MTTARRRRGAGHELRDLVLEVATQQLAELGDTDALTMRAVAAAAGVTPPSVYRHFKDKQTLVREIITGQFEVFTNTLTAAASAGGEQPMARLEAMSNAYVGSGLSQPGHYRVLFSASNAGPSALGLPAGTEHPGAASYRSLVDAVSACLPPPRRSSAPTLATELWASLHGIVDLRITKPELPWPDPDTLIAAALCPVRDAANPTHQPPENPSWTPSRSPH